MAYPRDDSFVVAASATSVQQVSVLAVLAVQRHDTWVRGDRRFATSDTLQRGMLEHDGTRATERRLRAG